MSGLQEHPLKQILEGQVKSAMQVYLSTNAQYTTNSGQEAKILLDKIAHVVGNQLTFEKNSVKIGKNVHHIKISCSCCLNTNNTSLFIGLQIIRNDEIEYTYQKNQNLNRSDRAMIEIPSAIVEVQENDYISVYVRTVGSPNSIINIVSGLLLTNLYIEVLD